MTGDPLLDALIVMLALGGSTFAEAAEWALEAVPRARLEPLAAAGDRRAQRCLDLKERSEDLRAAVLIDNVFLLLVAAETVTPYIGEGVGRLAGAAGGPDGWVRAATLILTAVLIGSVFVVFSSLAARSIGLHYAEALALASSRMMRWLTHAFRLPRRVLTVVADLLIRPTGRRSQFAESVVSEENLMDMLEEGTKTGVLDQTEHDLIESIFEFTETTAREIMIPRPDIVAIDAAMDPACILDTVTQEGYTRMPVYRESLDNVVGVIYAKDVVALIEHPNLLVLDDILRPAFFVPETKPISELLREFQRQRIHLAIVVDEFGGTEGLITLEDILEEIVGEIRDEYDEESKPVEILADGSVVAEGAVNVTDFNDSTGFSIPESDDYDTVGGFVTAATGRIPSDGDSFRHADLEVTVVSVDERRVKRVRIARIPADDAPEA